MKKLNQILNSSIFSDSSSRGIDFLKSVASYFGELIDKDRIVITKIGNENPGEATVVVHCNRGVFLDQVTYNLNGTPCQNVTAGNLCIHRNRIQQLFPDDTMLVTMDVSCYIGIPLWSMDGRIMGLVAVMDRDPLKEAEAEEIALLLKIISAKIAHSLEGEILASQNLALEERYRKLFDNARPAILILDPSKIADCNKTALRLFSCGKNEIIGKSIGFLSPGLQDDLTPSEEKIANFISKALDSEVSPFEWTFISREGKVIYSEITLNRVELGGQVCIEAVINEVTEQKKSALSFREERDFAEMIIDSLPGRFVLYDITYGIDDARLVRINRKWHTEVLGYEKDDMETISPAFFFESNDDSRINSTLKELIEENYVEVELNTMHKRGYIVPMLKKLSNSRKRECQTYSIRVPTVFWFSTPISGL
jgi:PAS domain S-box-containing protein